MKSTLTRTLLVRCLLTAMPFGIAVAQENCDEGSIWEPYTAVCAEVRDVRDEFLPGSTEQAWASEITKLVPGGLAVGTTYRPNELVALESGRLHTRMFVHPDGLQPDGPMPLLATPARNRVHHSAELAGMYPSNRLDAGVLGLFGWSCLPEYPCPDGRTSPGWQWFRDFSTLGCNITHIVDQGNHAQKVLYYANHTDKLDNGTPPQYKDAVYLWNYCDAAWDLVWSHVYREDKVDCSVPGSGCAWWGPSLETFGDSYPQIAELGFEDSLLYHDGVWSELRWPEAGFRDPAVWATYTPWQLFHLDPNRSYGVGNFLNENDPPSIDGQIDLYTLEDEPIELNQGHLIIDDPDVDPAYHSSFELTLYSGDNYTFSGTRMIPASNFTGTLTVPVTVSDGAAESPVFDLKIDVLPATVVNIDIKPRSKRNVINPRKRGAIWVAVLSDTDAVSPFDPSSQIDISTVQFGPNGASAKRYKVKDINRDGVGDLLLRFKIPKTGIACGDTEATLIAETFDGLRISGTDSIRTVGC